MLTIRASAMRIALVVFTAMCSAPLQAQSPVPDSVVPMLDAPLLFVKRHSYTGIHIYDTFYKWPPGGGGIYILENPQAPQAEWVIRPVIDPSTPETLGLGVYTHPELSYDAKRLLFCFKGEPEGSTSIYEIGVDGRGLRRVSDPTPTESCYSGRLGGQHDVAPTYLPDGRIAFLSTRPSGLVPCNNTGVAILHVMNADGSDMHPISVNNVNEFDPVVLPDGRILLGRWEYVDKNALTVQSLWTMNPDGTQETAFFANNMVFPEAILDARPIPGTDLIVGTFAKHNSTPRGSIAIVDPLRGKNSPEAITNLEHPDDPTFDRGDSCEPWPLSADVVLFSGRPTGAPRNVIEVLDRSGQRAVLLSDPDICLHSPMLVKPRPAPPIIPDITDRTAKTGRFFVQDIYRGLTGVARGEVKWLRVIEETSRVSATHTGANPYNQTFLLSCALAFSVKNYLGIVPVDEDGSAYFEAPSGRAVYLQALDADGRLVQSMRTFVQAAPGTTRSCIGCHEYKYGTTPAAVELPGGLARLPHQLQKESWGSGFVDYPSMVQPVLDRRCVRCHGGAEGIAGGMDLSGGWTEHFNISYENLTSRRETQLIAHWIAGIDCMNGTAPWSVQIFPPRSHGSGAAPLAKLLLDGHDGQIPDLTRPERDLLMAWIDTNGLYHGTWDYSPAGCAIAEWNGLRGALVSRMQAAGCMTCHGAGGQPVFFENDWINLEKPELSRILRAPLAAGGEGFGLGFCRDRKVDPQRQRLRLLRNGYAHAVQPPEAFPRQPVLPPDPSGEPVVSFASVQDDHYQNMLAIIREGREAALAHPRIDMPGAEVVAGSCRDFVLPDLPEAAPSLSASLDETGSVQLTWERTADAIGLEAEIHRSARPNFTPSAETLLAKTKLFRYADTEAPLGTQQYAVVLCSGSQRSAPWYASVTVLEPPPPAPPTDLQSVPASAAIRLRWTSPAIRVRGYQVYRAPGQGGPFQRVTESPVARTTYVDPQVEPDAVYRYVVRSVNYRGVESEPTPSLEAVAHFVREPVLILELAAQPQARLHAGTSLPAKLHGQAKVVGEVLHVGAGGHLTLPHDAVMDLAQPLSVECWVWFDDLGRMPVVVSCGLWKQAGWFVQRLGNSWRWHVGGIDCDGGRPVAGRWFHLAATYDGQVARLYENGVPVAEQIGSGNPSPWAGAMHVGQYSGQPGPDFQVTGRITGVKLYHRALDSGEIAAAAQAPPE